MEPPTANQKRKRGRPTNALRDDEIKDASKSTTTMAPRKHRLGVDGEGDDAGMEAEPRPKKRGRRPKNEVPQESQLESSETQPSKRRRRLPPAAEIGNESTERTGESIQPEEIKTKRRGRPRKEGQPTKSPEPEAEEADDENENEGENEGDSSLLRRSRRNRRLSDKPSTSQETGSGGEQDVGSSTQQATKRRKRPNQPVDKEQPSAQAEDGAGDNPLSGERKRKRRKAPLSKEAQPLATEGDPDSMSSQKKGRQSKPGRGGDPGPSTKPQDISSQRPREPANDESQVKKRRGRPSATHQKPKGRRRSFEEQEQPPTRSSSPDSISSPLPYRHIAKHTRRVTHEVIESKWSSLDPSSVANVANILRSVSLPTLLHVVPKQYAHAEDILERVIRGLRKRSAMLPFPPASTLPRREDELDFERTQSAVEALTSQLDPLQHSVELLRREKERAEKQLEREYKVLDRLSTNARAEARERKDRLRKVHVLVPEAPYGSAADRLDLLPADKATGQVFAGAQDAEILDVAKQINNHMESMRGNIQQINGVLPAIAESHALLKTALQPQFSRKQLEHIVLG